VNLAIPDNALVVLIGPSGAGKSTFAGRHFGPTEVVSSDFCRALVSGDENNIAATPAAFRVLHAIARERLKLGRLAVIDATNVRPISRKPLVALARKHRRPCFAIAFHLPVELCLEHNRARAGRTVPDGVVLRQHAQMVRSQPGLHTEGFDRIYVLDSAESVDSAVVVRGAAAGLDSASWPTGSA
jgi:protein phosphatase